MGVQKKLKHTKNYMTNYNKEFLGGCLSQIYSHDRVMPQDSFYYQSTYSTKSTLLNDSSVDKKEVQWWHKDSKITRKQAIRNMLDTVHVLEKTESDSELSEFNQKKSPKIIEKMISKTNSHENSGKKRKNEMKSKKLSKKLKN